MTPSSIPWGLGTPTRRRVPSSTPKTTTPPRVLQNAVTSLARMVFSLTQNCTQQGRIYQLGEAQITLSFLATNYTNLH